MGENTSLQPVDTAKNPVMKVDINSASIVGRKIESTVNTQLSFSFSTPPSTVNSQQSTVNNNSGATGIDIISLGKRQGAVSSISLGKRHGVL
jgi:hypothetical protein